MSVLPIGFGSSGAGYQIENSLRFRASASSYLSRTFGAPTSSTVYTWVFSVKRGKITSGCVLVQGYLNANNYGHVRLKADDTLEWREFAAAANNGQVHTNGVSRDPSAHSQIIVTRNGTTVAIYANGETKTLTTDVAIAAGGGYLSGNAVAHRIGHDQVNADYFDGLLSDVYFIDGQALTPSSFGETNSDGVWVPKAYTGTYGSNGFYLDFSDATSTTTLGYDAAGSNDWTCNNISLTAGVTYDSMVDTPTNNYATLNLVGKPIFGGGTISDANLKFTGSGTGDYLCPATVVVPTTKTYWEAIATAAGAMSSVEVGLILSTHTGGTISGLTNNIVYLQGSGSWRMNATSGSGTGFALNDILGLAYDRAAGTLDIYKNNTLLRSITSIPDADWYPMVSGYSGSETWVVNFGQRPFAYTPPTGFLALCTANLPAVAIPNPSLHHSVHTVTKSGNTNFTLPWDADVYDTLFEVKRRDAAGDWYWVDGLRGHDKILKSNTTDTESTDANVIGVSGTTVTLKSTLTDGTYVVYCWKAGLTASRQTNTDGSITSTVSRNVTSGFAIVTYTGTGANATVGHGLGVAPKMVIAKAINPTAAESWGVYHDGLGSPSWAIYLNLTQAKETANTQWNDTTPTTTVFSIGTAWRVNENTKTFVAYVHAEIPGYSKFGSYVGNGSADGPFVWEGFLMESTIAKRSDSTSNWRSWDTARDTYNVGTHDLYPNTSDAETTGDRLDENAGGLKIRHAAGVALNESGGTYIYASWAHQPFGGSNCSPSPAR